MIAFTLAIRFGARYFRPVHILFFVRGYSVHLGTRARRPIRWRFTATQRPQNRSRARSVSRFHFSSVSIELRGERKMHKTYAEVSTERAKCRENEIVASAERRGKQRQQKSS